jgi:hypothetical protein
MLLQKERGASQHKQIIDTHRKHILDMAIGTSKELYVKLTESIITGSINAKSYQYGHADMAVMPSCKNTLVP